MLPLVVVSLALAASLLMLTQIVATEYRVRMVQVPRLVVLSARAALHRRRLNRRLNREVVVVYGVPVTIKRSGTGPLPAPDYGDEW